MLRLNEFEMPLKALKTCIGVTETRFVGSVLRWSDLSVAGQSGVCTGGCVAVQTSCCSNFGWRGLLDPSIRAAVGGVAGSVHCLDWQRAV